VCKDILFNKNYLPHVLKTKNPKIFDMTYLEDLLKIGLILNFIRIKL